MNRNHIVFVISLVFFFTVIIFVAKGPLPFKLMGKSFEIREPNGNKVQAENREKTLFIKFGYFSNQVSGYDGCNQFEAKLIDLGLGQFLLDKIQFSKNKCRHYPYPVERYKSLYLDDEGKTSLQFTPYGLGKQAKRLGLQSL